MIRANFPAWERPEQHPAVAASGTHVWRIPLDQSAAIDEQLLVLSDDERERVSRFHFAHHGRRFAVAHNALRQILAAYEGVDPRALRFATGQHGKPEFVVGGVINPEHLYFNLSHSGEVALLAVARHGAVGVDVERWRTNVHHLDIAQRFFSPYEREALHQLPNEDAILRGFFATWSRKEAYLKATGHGIARGLHHFDVTIDVGTERPVDSMQHHAAQPARLIADRLDAQATERWCMRHLDVGPGYSGALVTTRGQGGVEGAVALFASPYI